MLSESKYLADLWVGFLGKKPQTLLIPIYSTTVLYDSKETKIVTYTCRYSSGHLIPNLVMSG